MIRATFSTFSPTILDTCVRDGGSIWYSSAWLFNGRWERWEIRRVFHRLKRQNLFVKGTCDCVIVWVSVCVRTCSLMFFLLGNLPIAFVGQVFSQKIMFLPLLFGEENVRWIFSSWRLMIVLWYIVFSGQKGYLFKGSRNGILGTLCQESSPLHHVLHLISCTYLNLSHPTLSIVIPHPLCSLSLSQYPLLYVGRRRVWSWLAFSLKM